MKPQSYIFQAIFHAQNLELGISDENNTFQALSSTKFTF